MQYKFTLLALLVPLALGCDNRQPNDKPGAAGLGNGNNGASATALTRPGDSATPPPSSSDHQQQTPPTDPARPTGQ